MAETVFQKGTRLHEQGNVGEPTDATLYPVTGDHGKYIVVVEAEGHTWCTCPATGTCAHLFAVARERAFGKVS